MISAASIAKVLGYALLVIPGAAKFSNPELIGQAAVVISNVIGLVSLVVGEVKKNKETKEIKSDVAVTKAISEIAIEAATGVPSPIPVNKTTKK